jgi:hypothetical protein
MPLALLTDTQLYHYAAIGGGVVIFLALLLYFLVGSKVPGVVVGVLGGLVAGLGLGAILMVAYGHTLDRSQDGGRAAQGAPPPGKTYGKFPAAQDGKTPDKPAGKKGPKGPTPTQQLVELLSKLDMLTGKQPRITLSPEQKKAMLEKLEEVNKKDFDDVNAISVLSILLDNLKHDRAILEDVGFRWPPEFLGSQPPPRPPQVPIAENPHLLAVRKRLSE